MQQLNENMTDKIILVAGGEHATVEAIAAYFLKKDATVIVPAKSLEKLNKLKAALADIKTGNLITQLAELPDYDTGFDISEIIVEKFGRIDIGISFFAANPCSLQLTEAHISDWENLLDNEMTPFFVSARLVLQTMKNNNTGLYISICDSNQATNPLSKIADAVKMQMSKMFADETKKYGVKYYHLAINNKHAVSENTGLDQQQYLNDTDTIGNYIMQLYLGKTEKPGEVFQMITEEAT